MSLFFWMRWELGFIFVCLGFIVPLKNFSLKLRGHHYWWRATKFDLPCHSWPSSSEDSLACNPFIMVMYENSCHSHLLPSVKQCNCHSLFYDLGPSKLELWYPFFRCRANALTYCSTAAVIIANLKSKH